MKKELFSILAMVAGVFSSLSADTPTPNPTQKPFGTLSSMEDPNHHPLHKTQFGYFYTKDHQLVPPEHSISFDQSTVYTCGIHHEPGTGDFYLKEPGIYRVIYSVSLKKPGMVALNLDGHTIKGSEMSVGSEQLSTLALLIKICNKSCCEHVLRLVNDYPPSSGWYTHDICLGTCNPDNVTAAIEIERISD